MSLPSAEEPAPARRAHAVAFLGAVVLGAAVAFRTPLPPIAWLAVAALGAMAFTLVALRVVPTDGPAPRGPILALAGIFALTSSVGVFFLTHHALRIDNALDEPVAIWVDGVRRGVVPIDAEAKHLAYGFLADGWHTVGEGPVDAPAPRSTAVLDLRWGAALYSPGGDTCYWRSVVLYGDPAEAPGVGEGPLPRGAVMSLAGVDDVFVASPEKAALHGRKAAHRVRVDRDDVCTDALRSGCPEDVIDMLAECRIDARDDEGVGACVTDAAIECAKRRSGDDQNQPLRWCQSP